MAPRGDAASTRAEGTPARYRGVKPDEVGKDGKPVEADTDELVEMIADRSLLGAGDADRIWPRDLRALHACETSWRVVL